MFEPSGQNLRLLGRTALVVICCATMAQKRPSSLQKPGARVRFAHSHQRVTQCKVTQNDTCQELWAKAGAAAELTLEPLASRLVSEPGPARSPIQVSIPAAAGAASVDVRVPEGSWQLAWASERSAFRVQAGEDFVVGLKTVSGECVLQGATCVVKSDTIRHSLTIPPQFAAAL